MNPFYYSRRFFTKKQIKKIVLVLIFSLFAQSVGVLGRPFVNEAKAGPLDNIILNESLTATNTPSIFTSTSPFEIENENKEEKPEEPKFKKIVVSSKIRRISAYNAGDVNQCDSDPCTAANGENICLALERGYKRCAANFVPFGTILEIEGYGECMVVDRMNSRYPNGVDIAMKYSDKAKALQFGRRSLNVKIISREPISTELAYK